MKIIIGLLLISLLFVLVITILTFLLYKYYVNYCKIGFSKITFSILISTTMILTIIFSLLFWEIISDKSDKSFKLNSDILDGIVNFMNAFLYIVLPLPLTYLINYYKQNDEYACNEDEKRFLIDNESNLSNMNHDSLDFKENKENVDIYKSNEFEILNINVFKDYFYYCLCLVSVCIISYILHSIHSLDKNVNIAKNTIIPIQIREIYGVDFFKSIQLFLFGLTLTIGKIYMNIYLPQGILAIVSQTLNKIKKTEKLTIEYRGVNGDIAKNYEIIKKITSERLMVGIPLTKKEALSLKKAREQIDVLDHKQEILEEKTSLVEKLKSFLAFPIHVITIILVIIISLILLYSKSMTIFNQLFNNLCGYQCGFITNVKTNNIIQDTFSINVMNFNYFLLETKRFYFSFSIHTLIIIIAISLFYISCILEGIKKQGLITFIPIKNFSELDIQYNHLINALMYLVCFMTLLTLPFELFTIFPDFMTFGYFSTNKFNSNIQPKSYFSYLMLSFKVNFPLVYCFFILLDISMMIGIAFCFFKNDFIISNSDEKNKDKNGHQNKNQNVTFS